MTSARRFLSTGDLFGFAEAQGRVARPDHLTVYPRVIHWPKWTSRAARHTAR